MRMSRKWILAMVFAAVFLCACSPRGGKYPKSRGSIRLLQYNVGSFGKFPESGIGRVADVIKALDADIVSLNEVDSCTSRRGFADQAKELSEALGDWQCTYARAMPYKGGAYGNAIVSRIAMTPADPIALDKTEFGYEPRVVAASETERFVFLSVHLDLRAAAQIHQIGQLTAAVKSRYAGCGKPVFLLGDMNDLPDTPVLDELRKDWDILSDTSAFTFPCPDPDRTIDYVMMLKGGPKCKVTATAVPYEVEGVETASDHWPLYVDVKF